jgi:hypothetical protein
LTPEPHLIPNFCGPRYRVPAADASSRAVPPYVGTMRKACSAASAKTASTRLETPLPADEIPGKRCSVLARLDNSLENRSAALLAVLLVGGSSFSLVVSSWRSQWVDQCLDLVREAIAIFGVGPLQLQRYDFDIALIVSMLWFYPAALRLGLGRGVLWICLAGFAGGIGGGALGELAGVLLAPMVPGFALIGRRTKPWLIVPATIISGLLTISGIPSLLHASNSSDFVESILVNLVAVIISFPYAAILIYGTKLIPKLPSQEPLID